MRFLSKSISVLGHVLALLACCAPVSAGDPVPEADAHWQAVGRLTGPGFRMKRGCSGTLIAPDLVVTAAHCMLGAQGNPENQQFFAGWHKGASVATRGYTEISLHPLYTGRHRPAKLRNDIAVVRLSSPIPTDVLRPVDLVSVQDPLPDRAVLLGYPHSQRDILQVQHGCTRVPYAYPKILRFDCAVESGTSGGAVFADAPGTPALSAVIVARNEPDGTAIAVPVNLWLREKHAQAMERAAQTGTGKMDPDL